MSGAKELKHWETTTSILGAGGLVLHQGKVLLVRVAYGPAAGGWILPGGKVERDEHPSQAAIREVREETGLDVECRELIAVRHRVLETRADCYFVFRAELKHADAEPALTWPEEEILEARFWPIDELLRDESVRPMTRALVGSLIRAEKGFTPIPLPPNHRFKDEVWVAPRPASG